TYLSDTTTLLQHETNGRLYKMSADYATDDGTEFPVEIITPNFDGGTRRRKMMNMLTIISDQTAGAKLQVRVNDKDYDPKGWTNWRSFDLSQRNPWISGCGTFTRRVHHFRYKSAVKMPRIQGVEMQLDIGSL